MTATQLDWKFGPEGLDELGDKNVLVCFLKSGLSVTKKASVLLKSLSETERIAWVSIPVMLDIEYRAVKIPAWCLSQPT